MNRTWSRAVCTIAVLLATVVIATTASALQVGDKAPDFTLTSPDGKPVKLADLVGKGPVVLYTFIQAFTGT
jgi:thioredoxin-dependent peroxiredoxin